MGNDQGFVLVSGETGTEDEVLGYCDHGSFDYDSCPVQMKDLLISYSSDIDSLRLNPQLAVPRKVISSLPSYMGSIIVGPLLTTTWDQWGPYNSFCPTSCPTGCYPTALAQLMMYWKWPKVSSGKVRNEDFSGHVYDWSNMLDDYSTNYTRSQADAVGKLMADIGKAFGTSYSPEGSATNFNEQPLIDNFGYEPGIKEKKGLTASALQEYMRDELDKKRPILYCGSSGYDSTEGSHALVCDGYTNLDYFHFNYGWGGAYDGFYKNALISRFQCDAYIFTNVRPYDAEKKVIDGIEYGLLKNGTAEIINYTIGKQGQENGELTIPAVVADDDGNEYKVTRILKNSFFNKGHFTKMTLGDNIEVIERFSFISTNIDDLVLSDKMEVVPDEAFQTSKINSLTIGASVKRIGNKAFAMTGLTKITSKSPAFEVGNEAFYWCMRLDCGDWLGNITKIGSRTFGVVSFSQTPDFKKLEEVGSQAFISCSFPNNTFVIPPKLKSISPDAFDNTRLSFFIVKDNPNFLCSDDTQSYLCNSNGTSLIMTANYPVFTPLGGPNFEPFPKNLVKLEPGSVRPYANVVVPNTIIEMEGAFKDCTEAARVISYAVVPPVITDNTFSEKMIENGPILYVPKGCKKMYAYAPGWRLFDYIYDDEDYEPASQQGLQYYMVVNGIDKNHQRVRIPISEVDRMELSEDGQHVVIKRNGKDEYTTTVAAVDSITWMPGFVYENAEVFDLNDSTLTVEAQKCKVTFSSTCIDGDVQLSIRNGVLRPDVTDGITHGITVDLNLSDGSHELSGTADIVIPVQLNDREKVNAAYFNEEEGRWEPVCFKYDETSGTVTISTNHLSVYSVFFTDDIPTCLSKLSFWGITPNMYEMEEALKKLLYIVSSDDPDAQMAREFKDEMSLWQSVGLDGLYNIVTSVSEPLLNFKPEALDNAVNFMGYLGTAMSILDVVGADIKGDNVGVLKGTLSTVLNYAGGQMVAAISTPIMAACSGCVAFIGIALEKLNTTVQEHKRDMFRAAYRYYYSKAGNIALQGDSKFPKDQKNPNGYLRTTKDWYNYFYSMFAEGKLSEDKLIGVIELAVHRYCDRFWEDNEAVRTWSYEWAKTQGLSSYMWISESDMQQICDEYYADLINGEMVSVIQAIKNNLKVEANNRYHKALDRVASIVNTQYKLQIYDSSKPKEGKSKYAGWKMRFANIASTVSSPQEWECTIGDDGTATLGYFTVYALLQNEMPFEVVLCDLNNIERKTWNFTISEHTGKRIFNVDLAKSGVEVEAPKLLDLKLTYDPDVIEIPMSLYGYDYEYDKDNNLVKVPYMPDPTPIDIRLDGSFNKNARFQYELEKFFKSHDFITVDNAGNIKIGDDIVGTMTGIQGSGSFTINTRHKFIEKTKEEFVRGINNFYGDVKGIFNLLNGTVEHKINCEFKLVRNEADDSYTVTYTGNGTYHFIAEGVALVENFNYAAFKAGENQKLTVDDICTGITESDGKVSLQYTVKLR